MRVRHITRAIFETLRLKIVELGYFPDVRDYAYSSKEFQEIAEEMRTQLPANHSLIEVYNRGLPQNRGEKKATSIYISPSDFAPGTLGGKFTTYYKKYSVEPVDDDDTGVRFNKYYNADHTFDLTVEIRYIASNVSMERLVRDIIFDLLSGFKYLYPCGDDGEFMKDEDPFLLKWNGYIDGLGDYEFLEGCFKLVADNVDITEPVLVQKGLRELVEVNPMISTYKKNEQYPE